jgi:hypothetical protein
LRSLRKWHQSRREMGGGSIQRQDVALWAAAKRHFGSYQKAVEAAGIQLPQRPVEWSWPADRLKQTIRQLHEQGVDLSSGRIRKSHPGLFYAARKKLGSWQKALESVGLDYESIRRAHDWTPQAVIDRLRQLHEAGEDLRAVAMQKKQIALSGAVQRYFGTHREAVKAAGLPYPETQRVSGLAHWTEELVLQTLRDLEAQGHDLRQRPMKQKNQPLYHAAKHFFGTYVNAVGQAGIDYWEMSQAQLKRERETRRVGRENLQAEELE